MRAPTTIAVLLIALTAVVPVSATARAPVMTGEVPFKSHDGLKMLGKLTVPWPSKLKAVVVYVQTAEGMTVDMKRPNGRGGTFNYFDLYREKLPEMGVGFFSYEGRGIRMGPNPPRYEAIDRSEYDTSSLDNKVRDALSAVDQVRRQTKLPARRVFLMGASEGTLIAAEAASRSREKLGGLILYGVITSNMRETFKYINTGGAFITYREAFDTDGDGKVSRAEYEADVHKLRETRLKGVPFETFDRNGDGYFTVEDMAVLAKPMLDALDKEDYAVLDAWASGPAPAVSLPKGWFKDHFAHAPIWTFLSKLDIPVGCFHGDHDAMVPMEGLKKMEEQARASHRDKMEFHYFKGLDHSLNIGLYFVRDTMPEGHKAIFEFVRKTAGK